MVKAKFYVHFTIIDFFFFLSTFLQYMTTPDVAGSCHMYIHINYFLHPFSTKANMKRDVSALPDFSRPLYQWEVYNWSFQHFYYIQCSVRCPKPSFPFGASYRVHRVTERWVWDHKSTSPSEREVHGKSHVHCHFDFIHSRNTGWVPAICQALDQGTGLMSASQTSQQNDLLSLKVLHFLGNFK